MMKKIIASIVVILLLIFGVWKYAQWYAEQYAFEKVIEHVNKKAKDKIQNQHKQAKHVFDMAMQYYRKGKPQPYLAQKAFFKYIDCTALKKMGYPEISEDEIINHVKQLLHTELVDVNAYNEYDRTALFNASEHSEYNLVKLLLESGAKVNQLNHEGTETALFAALLKPDIVKLLLQHDADPNVKGQKGNTVLMEVFHFVDSALHHDHPEQIMEKAKEIINLLLAYGADSNIKNDKGKTIFDILKESQTYFKTGKRKVGDEELTAHWANKMSEDRKMVIQSLDEIEHSLQSRGKVSGSK